MAQPHGVTPEPYRSPSSWTLCCFLSGLSVELVMIQHQPPQPNESAHDGNIHLDRSLAPENARKHRDTLFRESTG